MTDKQPLIGLTLDGLGRVAESVGLRPFAARQMAAWLYHKRVTDIDDMTDLSKQARARLAEDWCIGREAPLAEAVSVDGTKKYLFRGAPSRMIESVYIPDRDRATICVSSQAGCRMNCKFCMTGRQGFHGDLTTAQIINQVLSIPDSGELTNLVFMGMGEPTDNLDAVLDAIAILTQPWGFAWSPKRITVSTIGRPQQMRRLLENTSVHIALSVHSPFSADRAEIMPVEHAYPVAEIIEMLREYDFSHQRRLSVEYIMWRGINDDQRHADALARLLHGTSARVNLIRYHSSGDDDPMAPASQIMMERFRDRLNAKNITATIRSSRGEDIMAACGMLAGKKDNDTTPLQHNSNE